MTTPSLEGPMDRPQSVTRTVRKVERVLWQELNYWGTGGVGWGEDPRTAPVKKVEYGGLGGYFYLLTQPANGKA